MAKDKGIFSTASPFSDPTSSPFDTLGEDGDLPLSLVTEIPIKSGRFTPICVMITGRRDAGKTYLMTILGEAMRRRYIDAGVMDESWPESPEKSYWKIVSNYWTSFSVYDQRIMDGVVRFEPWVKDMLFMADELQTELLNRRAMSRANVGMSNFLTMIRKRRVDCIFTTQSPTQIDPNVLYQVDVFIIVTTSRNRQYVTIHGYDWQGQWTGQGFKRREWPPPLSKANWRRTFFIKDPWKFFKMYNTDEVHATGYMGEDVRDQIIAAEMARSGNEGNLERLRMMQQRDVVESAVEAREEIEGFDDFINGNMGS